MKVDYIHHCGDDLTVVNAARVSFYKESDCVREKDENLIEYLASHKHFSPFNHCFLTFRVKAPIFVARQLVKHEYMPWNEISRRYVDSEPEFYIPHKWREKSEDKKQGSSNKESLWNHGKGTGYREEEYEHYENSLNLYNHMIEVGVAPEQARMILPQNMYTEWFWSGTLKAFAKMCSLRCKEDTQEETRFIADSIDKLIEPLFPVSWAALRKADL